MELTNTLVVFASLIAGAVDIGPASFDALDSLADLVGLALVVVPADLLADRLVAELVALAVGVDATNRFAETGLALEVVRALFVGDALDRLPGTGHHRGGVGRVSRLAYAEGALVDRLAEGVGPADGAVAGVHALVSNTGEGRGAVLLGAAADLAHLVQTDVAEEAVVVHAASHCREKLAQVSLKNECKANGDLRRHLPLSQRSLLAHSSLDLHLYMQIPPVHFMLAGQFRSEAQVEGMRTHST